MVVDFCCPKMAKIRLLTPLILVRTSLTLTLGPSLLTNFRLVLDFEKKMNKIQVFFPELFLGKMAQSIF
ncbi:hypothetical protein [Candidatus Lokiarchaeum ossiferum]|uniref:hypothetical protein n=1 Tax=Candidatus Lokiarchaeum ossiferum TaxID=2951803 RepID=UPI00352F5C52